MKLTPKIRLALNHLRTGVIAHPTDTIYGLSCLANNQSAIHALADLKQRDINKGFILLSSDIDFLLPYIDPNLDIELLQKITKPVDTPTTYLVPKSDNVSSLITGDHELLAVRITSDPLISYFCENTGSALISTSANTQGNKVAKSLLELRTYFGNELDFVLPPNKYNSEPSRIINLLTGIRQR